MLVMKVNLENNIAEWRTDIPTVRTPLHQVINYLEMALEGHLDLETRDNLSMSHAASKVYPHAHRIFWDIEWHLEYGFNLPAAIEEAIRVYRNEAGRRNLEFKLDISEYPKMVVGDPKKIKTVVANLTANSLKPTHLGHIFLCSSNDATNSQIQSITI